MTNPAKALSLHLLKKELENINLSIIDMKKEVVKIYSPDKDSSIYKVQLSSLKEQISQTNNWMIGIFGGLGVSVLGLLINNVIQQRKSKITIDRE